MKTLYLERSTGECRNGDWVEQLDLEGIERIVVGIGPGSFAGIRSAIAFAQGYAIGQPQVEVLGLPSPCAIAAEFTGGKLAVVGDARQGKFWIARFDGLALEGEVFQIENDDLATAFPNDYAVVSPDHKRIGELLARMFGDRYAGERMPTVKGLRRFSEANPAILKREPLPIYLNPAVRP